ncbi:MAG: bifunctional DNA primase/polymerase [Elusimicrobiota bacterium]
MLDDRGTSVLQPSDHSLPEERPLYQGAKASVPAIASSGNLQFALHLLSLGFCVIPIRTNSKRPRVRWGKFKKRRPTEAEVRGWWGRWPNAGIAIICGEASGNLCVLDVDPRNDGDQSMRGKDIPQTLTVRTGRGDGGIHYYFRSHFSLRSFQLLVGVDFKADGGYVLAPPSLHPDTGLPYEWCEGLRPGQTPIAPPPSWILELAETHAILPELPKVKKPIPLEALGGLSSGDPLCVQALESGQDVRLGERNLGTLNLLNYYKSKGIEMEQAIERVQGYIYRLAPGVSESPRIEQLAHVVRAARAVYLSPDPKYTFQCRYMLAMGMPCAQVACPLYKIAGRPRMTRKWERISDEATAPPTEQPLPLDEVRLRLSTILQEIADNPDGNIHIVRVESGVGKTEDAVRVFLSLGVTFLGATHPQLNLPEKIAQELGIEYCRFPQISEDNCIHHRIVKELLNSGSNYTQVVCPSCVRRNDCDYRQAQKPGDKAKSIIVVQKFHEFLTFYNYHGNPGRLFLVFDEDPLNVLRPPRLLTPEGLQSYRQLLIQALGFNPHSRANASRTLVVPEIVGTVLTDDVRENLRVHGEAADIVLGALDAGVLPKIPEELLSRYTSAAFDQSSSWVYEALKHEFRTTKRITWFINYHREVHELLAGLARGLTLTHQGLSFYVHLPPPPGKTVLILDATARAQDIQDVAGDRRVFEHTLPPVKHESRIYQLLNGNWSRKAIRRDTVPDKIKKKPGVVTRPSRKLGRILAAIFRSYPDAAFGIITHKASKKHVEAQLPSGMRPRFGTFGDQRGSNDFLDVDVLLVIGSPHVDKDAVRATAIRLAGHDVAPENMNYQWRVVRGQNGSFRVHVRWYQSPEMQAAHTYLVTNELQQALGRARHILAAKTICLITNEPVEGLPGIEFLTNEELIGEDCVRRSDSEYPAVEKYVRALFEHGWPVGVQDLVRQFPRVSRTTLSTHLAAAARGLGGVRQGRQWARDPECQG